MKVLRVLKDQGDHKVLLEQLVLKVFRVHKVIKVLREHNQLFRVHKELKALRGLKARKDQLVRPLL
jgi:hypothetical protein